MRLHSDWNKKEAGLRWGTSNVCEDKLRARIASGQAVLEPGKTIKWQRVQGSVSRYEQCSSSMSSDRDELTWFHALCTLANFLILQQIERSFYHRK
jgi:hypothetical protein